MEHVTSLDLFPPDPAPPFLTQGPILGVPVQAVTLAPDCLVLTCARGYGATLAPSFLGSAKAAGLEPGGEDRFNRWFASRYGLSQS